MGCICPSISHSSGLPSQVWGRILPCLCQLPLLHSYTTATSTTTTASTDTIQQHQAMAAQGRPAMPPPGYGYAMPVTSHMAHLAHAAAHDMHAPLMGGVPPGHALVPSPSHANGLGAPSPHHHAVGMAQIPSPHHAAALAHHAQQQANMVATANSKPSMGAGTKRTRAAAEQSAAAHIPSSSGTPGATEHRLDSARTDPSTTEHNDMFAAAQAAPAPALGDASAPLAVSTAVSAVPRVFAHASAGMGVPRLQTTVETTSLQPGPPALAPPGPFSGGSAESSPRIAHMDSLTNAHAGAHPGMALHSKSPAGSLGASSLPGMHMQGWGMMNGTPSHMPSGTHQQMYYGMPGYLPSPFAHGQYGMPSNSPSSAAGYGVPSKTSAPMP